MRRKPREQSQIVATLREALYCDECQKEVYAECTTHEWYLHMTKSKLARPDGNYQRRFRCPYCHSWVGCYSGTYIPLSGHIPTKQLRKGWELTRGLVYLMSQEFGFRKDALAQAIGLVDYKSIQKCQDIEKLREAYRFGLKIKEKARERITDERLQDNL